MQSLKKEIYLAGGCFWGTEKYLAGIKGVIATNVGYANGKTENPTYKDVCYHNTGHAETVKVIYNPYEISLPFLLKLYYDVINPISVNRQGADKGTQYRTGIYYVNNEDERVIRDSIKELQKNFEEPIAIEVMPLANYFPAENYHQKYLDKNPSGYCHIVPDKFEKVKMAVDRSEKTF